MPVDESLDDLPPDRPLKVALSTAGRSDFLLSAEAVAVARWLLKVVPEDEHQTLGDLIPQVAVVRWADARAVLSTRGIRERWGVCRATAYRWLRALGRQNGLDVRYPSASARRSGSRAPTPASELHRTRLRCEGGTVAQTEGDRGQ